MENEDDCYGSFGTMGDLCFTCPRNVDCIEAKKRVMVANTPSDEAIKTLKMRREKGEESA